MATTSAVATRLASWTSATPWPAGGSTSTTAPAASSSSGREAGSGRSMHTVDGTAAPIAGSLHVSSSTEASAMPCSRVTATAGAASASSESVGGRSSSSISR